MVNTPICKFCLQTGLLCPSCQEKLDKGEISELDVKIANELLELEKQFSTLKTITLNRIVHTNGLAILEVDRGDIPKVIGPKGKIIRHLEEKFSKRIRVVEIASSTKKIIQDILAPMQIMGVNKIFLPTGETERKIRVKRVRSHRFSMDIKTLEEAILHLTDQKVRIVFE